MAELTFNESDLQTSPTLNDLYTKLYEGFENATNTIPPDFTKMSEDEIKEYTKVCIKNSAYSMANAIFTSLDVEHYNIIIVSTSGTSFPAGQCTTTLKAMVFYKGALLADSEVLNALNLNWNKYQSQGGVEPESIGSNQLTINLNYSINACDLYTCSISLKETLMYVKSAVIALSK